MTARKGDKSHGEGEMGVEGTEFRRMTNKRPGDNKTKNISTNTTVVRSLYLGPVTVYRRPIRLPASQR